MTLLIVSLFTAFFLAMFEPVVELASVFIGATIINTVFTLTFSLAGNLLEVYTYKQLILHTVACAFLGRVLLTAGERISTYRPTVINPTRQ
jgi:hypothetical protein